MIGGHAAWTTSHGFAMAPAFPEDVSPSNKRLKETNHLVAITCLQWDCDGALNDWDREWMLRNLAAVDPCGVILVPFEGP
jgi:hypothetical protein